MVETAVVYKIEVLETGELQVRRADRVLQNGRVVSETFHRHVLRPGDDIAREDPRVQAVARAVWAFDALAAKTSNQRLVIVSETPQDLPPLDQHEFIEQMLSEVGARY